jgi:hypothetical protein
MTLSDVLVHFVLFVGAVSRERRDGIGDLVEQCARQSQPIRATTSLFQFYNPFLQSLVFRHQNRYLRRLRLDHCPLKPVARKCTILSSLAHCCMPEG